MKFVFIRSFLKNTLGSIAIEFALVMPIYILILTSGYELTMYALLQNKTQRLAGVMADTVARQNVSRETVEAYMGEASQFMSPFGFVPGRMTISQLQNINQSNDRADMRISWQVSFQGSATNMGIPGDMPLDLPDFFVLEGNQTAIVCEIKYQFTNFVFMSMLANQEFYVRYVTVPRKGDMNTLLGEDSIF